MSEDGAKREKTLCAGLIFDGHTQSYDATERACRDCEAAEEWPDIEPQDVVMRDAQEVPEPMVAEDENAAEKKGMMEKMRQVHAHLAYGIGRDTA